MSAHDLLILGLAGIFFLVPIPTQWKWVIAVVLLVLGALGRGLTA